MFTAVGFSRTYFDIARQCLEDLKITDSVALDIVTEGQATGSPKLLRALVSRIADRQLSNEFGYYFGQALLPNTHGLQSNLIVYSPSFKEACQMLQKYYSLKNPFYDLELRFARGYLILGISRHLGLPEQEIALMEQGFMSCINVVLASYTNEKDNIFKVCFSHSLPIDMDLFSNYSNALVSAGQGRFEVWIEKKRTSIPAPLYNKELFEMSIFQCDQQPIKGAPQLSRAKTIEAMIFGQPERAWTLQSVATEMSVSISTVRRWLNEDDTSIKDLLKNIRLKLAQDRLIRTSLSVKQLATELGYSDSSNFSAKFKEWTGMSPREFRQFYN